MKKMKIAIVGCGSISQAYLKNAQELYSDYYEVAAVCDIRPEQAKLRAEQFKIGKVLSLEQALSDPEIDIVLNLTVPNAHRDVCVAVLEAGKHLYTEKPFGVNRAEAAEILAAAKKSGKRVGCAPDTFMGEPIQKAVKAIRSGYIGTVFGAHCVCPHPTHGNENWHPEPFFYYQKGAGPMFDMGAYYMYALFALIGQPVESVMAMQSKNYDERLIVTQPHRGEKIKVEVDTHVVGMLRMKGGAIVSIINTLDVWNMRQPWIEVYGTEGSIILPDPNRFDGETLISRMSFGDNAWTPLPAMPEYTKTQRGAGLADMVMAINEDRPLRCSGEMGAHVTDIVCSFEDAAASRTAVTLATTCLTPLGRFEKY